MSNILERETIPNKISNNPKTTNNTVIQNRQVEDDEIKLKNGNEVKKNTHENVLGMSKTEFAINSGNGFNVKNSELEINLPEKIDNKEELNSHEFAIMKGESISINNIPDVLKSEETEKAKIPNAVSVAPQNNLNQGANGPIAVNNQNVSTDANEPVKQRKIIVFFNNFKSIASYIKECATNCYTLIIKKVKENQENARKELERKK